jgi:DNA-directed RNA polymerase subunit E'/Rpb7
MDPLFERRKLSKKVHVHSKFLQKNIQVSILAQLKMNLEGRCSSEGFIQHNSIVIVNYSLGRANYIKGGVDYEVEFQADICLPHLGQIFKAPVTVKSKIGIHAETPPIKVLIPRDLHIGNEEFEDIKVGDNIEFEVMGAQFKQQDKDIVVLGKLVSKVKEEQVEESTEKLIEIPTQLLDPDVKNIVTEPEKPKRKLKLTQPESSKINELVSANKEGET